MVDVGNPPVTVAAALCEAARQAGCPMPYTTALAVLHAFGEADPMVRLDLINWLIPEPRHRGPDN